MEICKPGVIFFLSQKRIHTKTLLRTAEINGINYQAPKDQFTTKLMKLKLQGPSLAKVLPKTLGEASVVFIYNSISFYLKKLLSVI